MPSGTVDSISESSASHSALDILRARTRELHAQLESAVDLNAALGSVASYTCLLRGYWNIYTSFEAALQTQRAAVREVVSRLYQSRLPLLQRDLRALGADPSDTGPCSASVSIPIPDLAQIDSVLGALYVVEGSSLGGQVIYREIKRRLNIDADSGSAFFFGHGDRTGTEWKRFTAALNEEVSQGEVAAHAAAAMFRAFECGLQMKRTGGLTL